MNLVLHFEVLRVKFQAAIMFYKFARSYLEGDRHFFHPLLLKSHKVKLPARNDLLFIEVTKDQEKWTTVPEIVEWKKSCILEYKCYMLCYDSTTLTSLLRLHNNVPLSSLSICLDPTCGNHQNSSSNAMRQIPYQSYLMRSSKSTIADLANERASK